MKYLLLKTNITQTYRDFKISINVTVGTIFLREDGSRIPLERNQVPDGAKYADGFL